MTIALLTTLVVACTQTHAPQVTQTTSSVKIVLNGGNTGQIRHNRAVQNTVLKTKKVQIANAVTSNTQTHSPEVTQTTSGVKVVLNGGSNGLWNRLSLIEPDLSVTSSFQSDGTSTALFLSSHARLTQLAVETLTGPGSPSSRVTQLAVETLSGPGNPNARLTQLAVETLVTTAVAPTLGSFRSDGLSTANWTGAVTGPTLNSFVSNGTFSVAWGPLVIVSSPFESDGAASVAWVHAIDIPPSFRSDGGSAAFWHGTTEAIVPTGPSKDVAIQIPFSDPIAGWTPASYASPYGPWRVGDNLYVAVLEATFNGPLHVAKSTDGGITWVLQDPTHAPAGAALVAFDPSNGKITATDTSRPSGVTGRKIDALRDFDTATNTWGSNYATAGLSTFFDVTSKAGMVILPDGSKVLVATIQVQSPGATYKDTTQVWYAVWDGSVWSTPVRISDNVTVNAQKPVTAISAVYNDATGKIHVVYELDDFAPSPQHYIWYHRTITASGTLGTISTVDDYFQGDPKITTFFGPNTTVLFKGSIYCFGLYRTGSTSSAANYYAVHHASLSATEPWTFAVTNIAPIPFESWAAISGFVSPDGNTLETIFQDDYSGAIGERNTAIFVLKSTSTDGTTWTTPTVFWDGWPIDESMDTMSAADVGLDGIEGIVAFGSWNFNTNVFCLNRITAGGTAPPVTIVGGMNRMIYYIG